MLGLFYILLDYFQAHSSCFLTFFNFLYYYLFSFISSNRIILYIYWKFLLSYHANLIVPLLLCQLVPYFSCLMIFICMLYYVYHCINMIMTCSFFCKACLLWSYLECFRVIFINDYLECFFYYFKEQR
jgi:hypothetical protein